MIQNLCLQIVHHFTHVQQKLMTFFLMKQIIFTLQCLCTFHIYLHCNAYAYLIEYSGSYSDTSGSFWKFKRDEVTANKADLTVDNPQSSNYKAALLGKTANHNDGKSFVKDAKIVVPLKYLSNFWRSLEMPLINCKVYLELNWIEYCVLSSAGNTVKFEIIDTKLHVSVVTLSTKDSANLAKQLSEGFKRSVYWNSYETKPAKVIEKGKNIYELLNASFKVLKDYLFLLILLQRMEMMKQV